MCLANTHLVWVSLFDQFPNQIINISFRICYTMGVQIKVKQLFHTYVDGWKENNIGKIIKPLTDDCIIVESHGPTYHGIEEVKQWFSFWEQEKGKVLLWDISSLILSIHNIPHSLSGVLYVASEGMSIIYQE